MSNKPNILGRFLQRVTGTQPTAVSPIGVGVVSDLALQYPVLISLREIYKKLLEITNKPRLYQVLKELDPELYGSIDRVSKMVRLSYRGVAVHVGHELDDHEKEMLKELRKVEVGFDLPGLFHSSADRLQTYGDDISVMEFRKNIGLNKLYSLPMEALTIVGKRNQIGKHDAQIFNKNFYIMNETGLVKRIIKTKDKIMHLSLNNKATVVHDLLSRYTFGVWSISPIEALKYDLFRKLNSKINEIIMKQQLVPKQHHKLDLSGYDPRYYAGASIEERIVAARAAAQKFVDTYKSKIISTAREPDRQWVTGKDVEIGIVEPRHVTYVDPNPGIEQINQSIYAGIGPVEIAVTGKVRTYAAALVISSYATAFAEVLGRIIKPGYIVLLKKHLQAKFGTKFTDEDLDKIDIKIQLVFGIEQGELVRQIAVLGATEIATQDELRNMIGLDPLTAEQHVHTPNKGPGRGGDFANSPEDIRKRYIDRDPERAEPRTPESRRDQQET